MPFRGLDTSEIEVRPCLHCLVRKTSQSNSLDQELFLGFIVLCSLIIFHSSLLFQNLQQKESELKSELLKKGKRQYTQVSFA